MSDDAFGFDDLVPKPAQNDREVNRGGSASTGANLKPRASDMSAGLDFPSGSDEANLMNEIKGSIEGMQAQMQKTYERLSDTTLTGRSDDKKVAIKMTATYGFEDIEFDENALQGGMKEFKWRIREAFRDLLKKIQDHTQSQTMDLLQGMHVPEELRKMGKSNDEDS